jgi:hypothetical protein
MQIQHFIFLLSLLGYFIKFDLLIYLYIGNRIQVSITHTSILYRCTELQIRSLHNTQYLTKEHLLI